MEFLWGVAVGVVLSTIWFRRIVVRERLAQEAEIEKIWTDSARQTNVLVAAYELDDVRRKALFHALRTPAKFVLVDAPEAE
ncbi:MAG: hypothetical protein WC869_16565 [Phycisphaerae bacterium]|jgi:hypothetical protein